MSLMHHTGPGSPSTSRRHDWTRAEVRDLFELPFPELMYRAAQAHREYFDPCEVQISTLLSVKTGGCPEDCAYCPQSAKFDTGIKAEKLMEVDAVLAEARAARASGASRFCMGAAWRSPKDRDLDRVCEMVEGVKALGMETCVTLGMLTGDSSLIPVPTAAPAASGEAASPRPGTEQPAPGTEPMATPGVDKGPPQTRRSPAPTAASQCPSCGSSGEPRVISMSAGTGERRCDDLWHIEARNPRDSLVLNVPANGTLLLGDVARERHVT